MLARVSEAGPEADSGRAAGKGRPTPKRSEARKKRRATTPTNRKEAAAMQRQRAREQRSAQRQALLSGDERNLPPRDAGPGKRLARDIVDSRFTLGQVFFGLVLAVLFLSLIPSRSLQSLANIVLVVLFATLVIDALRLGRRAKRAVIEKYGDKEAVGVTGYAAIRAFQPRRLRRPPPKVSRKNPA
jgi:Flp pilus assembly protein TadB